MSRVDQALNMWEAANGTAPPLAKGQESRETAGLEQYAPEVPNATAPGPVTSTPSNATGHSAVPPANQRRPTPSAVALTGRSEFRNRLIIHGGDSVTLEQYRRLAAVLHEEQVHRQLKTTMITSALPREGKTLTLVNLALTLSDSYRRRVLLVDADLRAPSIHVVLNIANGRGLSDVLVDSRHDPLPFVEVTETLWALTAGKPGRSPLAHLTSSRLKQVIEECEQRFDWVLIDTPPVGVLPDAQVLARLAGAVVFVISAGSTPAAAVERAIAELGGPDAITGTVLNRVDQRRIPEANYYGRYYYEEPVDADAVER